MVGAVQLGWVGVAAAAGVAAAHRALGEGAGQDEADLGDRGGDAGGLGPLGRGGRHVPSLAAGIPRSRHISQYKYCVIPGEVSAYVAGWQPVSVSGEAACFARQMVTAAAPVRRARANALLWAAARLADYAVPLGLEAAPEVLLHSSVIERFTAHAPGLSGPARRTLRTNLRFLARRVVPALAPADVPLARERAKAPYSPAEIDGFLALADAQPTAARRMRAAGLVCLGAGAGLAGADLRGVCGTDVI